MCNKNKGKAHQTQYMCVEKMRHFPGRLFNPLPANHINCCRLIHLLLHFGSLYLKLHGLHRLEKYLNLEGFLEKSLKIKSAWKSTGKSLKDLEKSLNFTI